MFYVIVFDCLKHIKKIIEIPGGRGFSFLLGQEGLHVKSLSPFIFITLSLSLFSCFNPAKVRAKNLKLYIEQWTMNKEQWTMYNEQWITNNEQCILCNEQWKMKNERWTIKYERWTMKDEQWIINNEL